MTLEETDNKATHKPEFRELLHGKSFYRTFTGTRKEGLPRRSCPALRGEYNLLKIFLWPCAWLFSSPKRCALKFGHYFLGRRLLNSISLNWYSAIVAKGALSLLEIERHREKKTTITLSYLEMGKTLCPTKMIQIVLIKAVGQGEILAGFSSMVNVPTPLLAPLRDYYSLRT